MAQRISLQIQGNQEKRLSKQEKADLEWFHKEDKPTHTFISKDLLELGIDDNEQIYQIQFDNNAVLTYRSCMDSCSICLLCNYCCLMPELKKRKAALTESILVMKYSRASCLCCCWNDIIKSIPLYKITDLSVQNDCCMNCYNIKCIAVQTASSNGRPELILEGPINPYQIRKLAMQWRDNAQENNNKYNINMSNIKNIHGGANVGGNNGIDKQSYQLMNTQADNMIAMKELLIGIHQEIKDLKVNLGGKGTTKGLTSDKIMEGESNNNNVTNAKYVALEIEENPTKNKSMYY